jgi:serine/threonine-protein kinase
MMLSLNGSLQATSSVSASTPQQAQHLAAASAHEITPLVQTPAAERNGEVSPDGRWLAYESDESGRFEIYVRSFPEGGSRIAVSSNGGTRPPWARSGRELFYLAPTGALMRVGIDAGSTWAATAPVQLFEGRYFAEGRRGGNVGRTYDVSRDGSRFLMIKDEDRPANQVPDVHLVVVQNWQEELKQRVPAH